MTAASDPDQPLDATEAEPVEPPPLSASLASVATLDAAIEAILEVERQDVVAKRNHHSYPPRTAQEIQAGLWAATAVIHQPPTEPLHLWLRATALALAEAKEKLSREIEDEDGFAAATIGTILRKTQALRDEAWKHQPPPADGAREILPAVLRHLASSRSYLREVRDGAYSATEAVIRDAVEELAAWDTVVEILLGVSIDQPAATFIAEVTRQINQALAGAAGGASAVRTQVAEILTREGERALGAPREASG